MAKIVYKSLTPEDVRYELLMEPETEAFQGEFEDKSCEDWIRDQLRAGNQWAWCTVRIRVTWGVFSVVSDPLGHCSYASEEDFKNDGYYEDMRKEALEELNSNLEQVVHDLRPRIGVGA